MLSKESAYRRYFMELAYFGKGYHGWQIQPNAITVQEVLTKALGNLLATPVSLVGAGRTDTGVHASHFVAHFDWSGSPIESQELVKRLNRYIPEAIRIDRIEEVHPETHSRFSAISRQYHYLIRQNRNPYFQDFSWYLPKPINLVAMNEAALLLRGYSDFTSFARLHADNKTNICSIRKAEWHQVGEFLVFEIQADRFLRNMVRALVGTLILVGTGKLNLEEFKGIIEQKDRSAAGQSAPAEGLFLTRIEYPLELFEARPTAAFLNLF